jgi:hypothetical protein
MTSFRLTERSDKSGSFDIGDAAHMYPRPSISLLRLGYRASFDEARQEGNGVKEAFRR